MFDPARSEPLPIPKEKAFGLKPGRSFQGAGLIFGSCSNPATKLWSTNNDGKEFRGVVVLTEAHTSGNRVRVRSGDFILNVDEKQVAKDE